jgi:hypothetical protein
MLTNKLRNISIAGVTTLALASTAAVPAVSQAQENNFAFLRSSEGLQLKTNPGTGPGCQPLFPVGGGGAPSGPIPLRSRITSVSGATQVTSAQQEVQSTAGSAMGLQVCEAG